MSWMLDANVDGAVLIEYEALLNPFLANRRADRAVPVCERARAPTRR